MKLWYSATEVKLMTMDWDLKLRRCEIDNAALLQSKDLYVKTVEMNSTRELNDYKLLAEKQRVVDLAAATVNIRNEYIVKMEDQWRKIAGLEAQVAEKSAMLSATNAILSQTVTDRSALLATVTELAKKPVIVEKTTQTVGQPGFPGQTFIVMDGKTQPIVKV